MITIYKLSIDVTSLLIGVGIVSILWFILVLFISRNKKPIKKEIGNAREDLRNLYKSYGKELFNIADKIDKHLETLEKS